MSTPALPPPRAADDGRITRAPRQPATSLEAQATRRRAAHAMLERLGRRLAACAPREAGPPTPSCHAPVAGASR